MSKPFFFSRGPGLSLRDIIELTGAEAAASGDLDRRITGIAVLDSAAPDDLAFLDKSKYLPSFAASQAGACLTTKRYAARAPEQMIVLCVREPYRAYVEVAKKLYPDALRPSSLFELGAGSTQACIHPTARMENGVIVDPGAIIGPRTEIGAGTVIGAGAVIGPMVRIGRQCLIGANSCLTNALIGDRVVVHPGCAIGQDGFGYVPTAAGHAKVLQVGRVIIQDDVEIGAGTTIDRGGNRDTVIGAGTKIDNLVQIGHNVSIGRNCIIVAQCGISGSVTLEDGVVLGGQVGLADNVRIGEGAMIGAKSGVMSDIAPGERWFGYPAMPSRAFFRSIAIMRRQAAEHALPGKVTKPSSSAGRDDFDDDHSTEQTS
jgi:UDP-3-O-[3-hydroxymyristoyl] glucosamine N-acyltransferase